MIEGIKEEWERDETHRCPFCGSYDFDWVESDEGTGRIEWDEKNHRSYWVNDDFHWYVSRCRCCECDKEWFIEYDMVNPRVYEG